MRYQKGDIFDKTNIVFKGTEKRDVRLNGHPMLIPIDIDFNDDYYYFFTISSQLKYYASDPHRYFPISRGKGSGLIKPSLVDLKHVYKYRKQSHDVRGYLNEQVVQELIKKFNRYNQKNTDEDCQELENLLLSIAI